MGRAIDEVKESTPRPPSRASTVLGPRDSIQCEASDPQHWSDCEAAKESSAKIFSKESSVF